MNSGEKEPKGEYFAQPDYSQGIKQYLEDGEKNNTLRPHQLEVFNDIGTFLEEGRRGYVELPTGTGKTVVFVELSKAIMETKMPDGGKPRILVVTPTVDLVNQTIGRGQNKGFGAFAPDLSVGSFFSNSTEEDKRIMQEADVVVTTYRSFAIMSQRDEEVRRPIDDIEAEVMMELEAMLLEAGPSDLYRTSSRQVSNLSKLLRQAEKILHNPKAETMPSGRKMLDAYDAYILDEVHHTHGETSKKVLASISPEKPVIGFTASPDPNEQRRLTELLPTRIHRLSFTQAISMGLLAPVVSLSAKSGVDIKRSEIYDSRGDFIDERMSHLAVSERRNKLVTDAAEAFTELGIGTLISCIAGNKALHAEIIARQLRNNGVAAEAVHGDITPARRREIYQKFEAGEIDVLTYIEILGEGYDTQRGKALINARLTRARITAQQRTGRVVRPGDVAFTLDIIDNYDQFNPPIFVPDLIDEVAIPKGKVYGKVTEAQQTHLQSVIANLGRHGVALSSNTPADFSNVETTKLTYRPIQSGNMISAAGENQFSLPASMAKEVSGVTEEIVDKLWRDQGMVPETREGIAGDVLRKVYDRIETVKLLGKVPVSDIEKAIKDKDGELWMSSLAITRLFEKRYQGVSQKIIEQILPDVEASLDWRPIKHKIMNDGNSSVRFKVYKAFKMNRDSAHVINEKIIKYFTSLGLSEADYSKSI